MKAHAYPRLLAQGDKMGKRGQSNAGAC